MNNAIRQQTNVISASGDVRRAWEFDIDLNTYYIQETEDGYSVLQLGGSPTGWKVMDKFEARHVIEKFINAMEARE